ncbi:response regulator transcription factor [Pseudohaliea rubra]|uniref:response regulator transcription factor n=1 Tax=Pseudohaliea rubra TaxID=475795 RepID=UPI001F2B5DD4|nr:response regulator transcription factor [Pseudohaliea rubra]
MIADDHPLFRNALTALLSDSGLATSVAAVADVAALHAHIEAEGAPELLLLDLHMPGTSGFSALGWYTGAYPGNPVVMISANTHPDTVRRAIDLGAAAFLSKSTSTGTIGDCLERVLAGERGLHPELTIATEGTGLGTLDTAEAVGTLTPQQFRVVVMLAEGLLNKQIAWELGVKEATVKAHMTEIFRKLGVHSRTQAVLALGTLNVPEPETLTQPPDSA